MGMGKIIAGRDVNQTLVSLGVARDFDYAGAGAERDVIFLHRHLADGDLYYNLTVVPAVNYNGRMLGCPYQGSIAFSDIEEKSPPRLRRRFATPHEVSGGTKATEAPACRGGLRALS